MTPKETVLEFVQRVNHHDVEGIMALTAKTHRFIDPLGHVVESTPQLKSGWAQYFEWFPDYEIVIGEIFEQGNVVALVGAAMGSFHRSKKNRWRIPAAWMAVVEKGRVKEWHVFADTAIPLASMK